MQDLKLEFNTNKPYILHTSFYKPFSEEAGGVEQMIYYLSKNLSIRNYNVDITCMGNYDKVENTQYGRIIIFHIPTFYFLGKFNIFIRKAIYNKRLRQFVKENGDKYYSIHIHGDVGGFRELSKFNTTITLHGFSIQTHADRNMIERLFIRFTSGRTELDNIKYAKKIVVVSKNVKKYVQKYTKKSINVIFNSVDTKKYSQPTKHMRNIIRRKLDFKKNVVYVIFVGGDYYRKGLDIAISSIKLLNNEQLFLNVIGTKPKSTTVCRNIRFLGKVDESSKLQYYQASDIFILPSRGEGFAISPLEAMSCGLPIIISEFTGTNEIIADGKEGFIIKKNNPLSYYKAINKMLKIKDLKNMQTNARACAVRHNYSTLTKEYINIYKKLD